MVKRSRKPRHRTHYSHMDVLLASPTQPMPAASRLHAMTRFYQALDAMQTAPNPTPEDWRALSDAVNLVETMLSTGLATDEGGTKAACIEAMGQAGQRYLAGKAMRLSGPGIQAMRALLADLDELMQLMPHRDMVRVHIATEKRVAEILRGKVRPGDVVVAA